MPTMRSWGRPIAQSLTLLTAPAAEPITLAEAKAFARVDHSDEDTLFTSLIVAARRHAEACLGSQFVTAAWRLSLDSLPDWRTIGWSQPAIQIPLPPLRSVTSLKILVAPGALQTISNTLYTVDTSSRPGRIAFLSGAIPYLPAQLPGAVQIEFSAGYGDASAVPDTIKTAIKMLVNHWYRRRDAVSAESLSEIPRAVNDLLLAESWGNL